MASAGYAPGTASDILSSTPTIFAITPGPTAAQTTVLDSSSDFGPWPTAFPWVPTGQDIQDAQDGQHQSHMRRVVTSVAITVAVIALILVLCAIAFIVVRRRKAMRQTSDSRELKDLSPKSSGQVAVAPTHTPRQPQHYPTPTALQRHNSTYGSGIDYSAAAEEGQIHVGIAQVETVDPPPPYQTRDSFIGGPPGRQGNPDHSLSQSIMHLSNQGPRRLHEETSETSLRGRRLDADNSSIASDLDRRREVSAHQIV